MQLKITTSILFTMRNPKITMTFDNTGGKFNWLKKVALSSIYGDSNSLLKDANELLIRVMRESDDDGNISAHTMRDIYTFLTSRQYHEYIFNGEVDLSLFSN